MLSVWIVGGLIVLCGALTLAEVAGALPETGGLYVFIRTAWGPMPAFLFGWAELAVIRAASLGAVSTTFAEYSFRLAGKDPAAALYVTPVHWAAAAAIVVSAGWNYRGIRWGSMVQNLTTIAKYGGLLALVIVALIVGARGDGARHFVPPIPPGSMRLVPFGLALVGVLWAYDGWADLSFVAGEVTNPRRNLPRALIGGTLAVIAIYVLANVAYLAVLPISAIRTSPLVAADVAHVILGAPGARLVAMTVVLSTLGTLNGSLLTAPRIFYAMAADGAFLRPVGAVHPRYGTPYVAIALTAALGVVFVLLRTFEQLADAFITAIVPFYALGVGAVFVLRRRGEHEPPFRVPLYPLVPAVFILAAILLLGNAIVDPGTRWATLAVLGVVVAGVPIYYATVGRHRGGGQSYAQGPAT